MEKLSLEKFYFEMLRIRWVEELIIDEYPKQEIRCPVHLSIGQEAVAVGVCAALNRGDVVFSSHRAHAHYLAQGGSLKKMMAELYLRKTGTCGGKGGSMHLADRSVGFYGGVPIVGSGIPSAVGAALGFVMKNQSNVAVVFFGDAATEEGVFSESLNFAALKKLPVVFVCENNFYSVNSPLKVRQPPERNISSFAEALNVSSEKGDGNKVEDVFKMMVKAMNDINKNKGPRFLEFETYRWCEHCGPNYDTDFGYRTKEEYEKWKLRDPLIRIANQLKNSKIMSEEEIESMRQEVEMEIKDALKFAQNSPEPLPEDLYNSIYAE